MWQAERSTLRLRCTRWTPCRTRRIVARLTVNCMVPWASIPSASSWAPTISRPSTAGVRWRAQTSGWKLLGSAVPACVPTKCKAGPGPAITSRAVPSATTAVKPTLSSSITIGWVMRYTPLLKRIAPAPESTAFWIAAVSSA